MLRRYRRSQGDGVTEQQRGRRALDPFGQSYSVFQYLLGGGLIGAGQHSRYVHHGRSTDSRFRLLRLFRRTQKEIGGAITLGLVGRTCVD